MINLDELKKLTPEQWESMSREQLLAVKTGMALVGIETKATFLNVALDNGKLTVDDAHQLQAIDEIMRETLQRVFPNGGWDKR
jgi:hypothetical protein